MCTFSSTISLVNTIIQCPHVDHTKPLIVHVHGLSNFALCTHYHHGVLYTETDEGAADTTALLRDVRPGLQLGVHTRCEVDPERNSE